MMGTKALLAVASVLVLMGAPSVAAQSTGATGPSFYGWGPRLGFADDPDQVVFGVHLDLGRFAHPRLQLQPNAELGLGDDATVFTFAFPVHYRFQGSSNLAPYAGGGVSFGLIDVDRSGASGSEFEIAVDLVGGLEWNLRSRRSFFVEMSLIVGDFHDVKVLTGWTFR